MSSPRDLETHEEQEEGRPPDRQSRPARAGASVADHAHLGLVMVACGFGLYELRAQALSVAYLNDLAVHSSMVRWAASRIQAGHLPFDGWYPYLSLGSSRFHHYQSLPAILTGALSLFTGRQTFAWSVYLLLAMWPLAVYWGARLLAVGRWEAAVAALISPLLASKPGLGYEWASYTWGGWGVWTQLWGMWLLPLAIGLSWRAVARRRSLLLGSLAVGLTLCVHLLTGYLSLLIVGCWVVIAPGELLPRLKRASIVWIGSIALAGWQLIPLVQDRSWILHDPYSQGTFYYDSFGAKRVLGWLFTGQIFDYHQASARLPVVSVLVAIGALVGVSRFRRDEPTRAVMLLGGLSLLLFFGRPTLGPVVDLLPGGSDLFLRRYIFGVHLAGIFLAGIGGVWLGRRLMALAKHLSPRLRVEPAAAIAVLAGIAILAPAWAERAVYAERDQRWISAQRQIDSSEGLAFSQLVGTAGDLGQGRFFAGLRSAPATGPRIGQVPGYAFLLDLDADAIGFTRPTWSLASCSESRFNYLDPADYGLFGVRFLITPQGGQPPVPATFIETRGPFALWEIDNDGYVHIFDTAGTMVATRNDLCGQVSSILSTQALSSGILPTVGFNGKEPAAPTQVLNRPPSGPAGEVLSQTADPPNGVFTARVRLNRAAVVVVSASYDPGWVATVDGHDAPTQMLAPGLVGVGVSPGVHAVTFTYHSYARYPELALIMIAAAVTLAVADRGTRGREAKRLRGPDADGVS